MSWGVLDGSTIHQLSDAPYLDATRTGQSVQRSSVKLEAPVDPKLVFMTAFNFRSHISGEPAEYPGLFLVPANSIVGPEDPIIRPAESTNLHYGWSWSSASTPRTCRSRMRRTTSSG
ncbi:MAG: Rv2993c-like domain-containing protein [Acidobacteriota bacterium]|nr:Rv2993c-like domain-containing protein [Acidobacteriota bacterium]